jgi:hypothetical protein
LELNPAIYKKEFVGINGVKFEIAFLPLKLTKKN